MGQNKGLVQSLQDHAGTRYLYVYLLDKKEGGIGTLVEVKSI